MSENKIVRYEDFGAKGDGVTNDFAAMKAAHAHANEKGLKVVAECGKTYLIDKSGEEQICIMTDTVWEGATIVIDDRYIFPYDAERNKPVFVVSSEYEKKVHGEDSELAKAIMAAGGIKTDTKKLPYAPGYPAMLIPNDNDHRVYIRYGLNQNAGQAQHEVIVIDENGNIDPDTPALLDYNHISFIEEYRIDDKPITILGGTVVTRANRAPSAYTYYGRNITVRRSNVTVDGLKHRITDESNHGAPYVGFLNANGLNNLLVVNCDFQAHRWYWNEDPSTGGPTCMGTYEIGGGNANKLYYKNCTQINFFDPNGKPTMLWYDKDGNKGVCNDKVGSSSGIWGVMGTNYCKNITYDNCTLNRLDAHAGVYNATIKNNSKVISVNLIGGGTALVEDSTIYNNLFINLRSDYGSFWHGDVKIKNSKFVCSAATQVLLNGTWTNHNFGYKTYLPNVEIDNLEFIGDGEEFYVFNDYAKDRCEGDISADTVVVNGETVENKNPMTLPESISIKNCNKAIKIAPEGSCINKAFN